MAVSDYGSISQRTAAWAATVMLDHAEPVLVLSKFGQSKPMPKNKAEGVKFRRPVPFALATTPLTEGVTPSPRSMVYADVAATLAQYGDLVTITDKVHDLAEDPVLNDAAELCGEQAAETVEYITWGILVGGTGVAYANGSARTDVNTVIEVKDLRGAVRSLKNQRGRPINRMLSGSPNYDTRPVEPGYIAFAHTDLEHDLRELATFVPAAKYGTRELLCPEEIGSSENVRIILSPVLTPFEDAGGLAATNTTKSTTGTDSDVYPVMVVAKNSYGLVPLKGAGAIVPSVLNPGVPSKSDPLGQRGYVGWKTWYTASRLNEAWMRRIEVAVTDL